MRVDFFISATIDKIFCIQNSKIKNIAILKIIICTEPIFFFYIEFEVVNVVAVVTYKPFYFFQEQFYMFTSRHTMLILSLSRLQKLHKTSCAMPISFNTIIISC